MQLPDLAWSRTTFAAMAGIALGVAIMAWPLLGPASTVPPPETAQLLADATGEIVGAELLESSASAPDSDLVDAPDDLDTVIVYVSGAVLAPDVYRLPANARVKDLVVAAGGLAAEADPDRINLADRLVDGQHVIVPRQGAVTDTQPDMTDASGSQDSLVNINIAGATELDELPGIGQALAERLVEYRAENGPFQSVKDLQRVKGIGPALFEKIAPLVTVGS